MKLKRGKKSRTLPDCVLISAMNGRFLLILIQDQEEPITETENGVNYTGVYEGDTMPEDRFLHSETKGFYRLRTTDSITSEWVKWRLIP